MKGFGISIQFNDKKRQKSHGNRNFCPFELLKKEEVVLFIAFNWFEYG